MTTKQKQQTPPKLRVKAFIFKLVSSLWGKKIVWTEAQISVLHAVVL